MVILLLAFVIVVLLFTLIIAIKVKEKNQSKLSNIVNDPYYMYSPYQNTAFLELVNCMHNQLK